MTSNTSRANVITHHDLVRNRDLFWDKFYASLGKGRETLSLPKVGRLAIDMHQLFIEVTTRGGYEQVIQNKKWREIAYALGIPASRTGSSTALREIYHHFIYQIECDYFNSNPNPIPAVVVEEPPVVVVEDPPAVGGIVDGFIEGTFESGYLVSFKIGSQVMRGVFYHVAGTSPPPGFPARPAPSAAPSAAPSSSAPSAPH